MAWVRAAGCVAGLVVAGLGGAAGPGPKLLGGNKGRDASAGRHFFVCICVCVRVYSCVFVVCVWGVWSYLVQLLWANFLLPHYFFPLDALRTGAVAWFVAPLTERPAAEEDGKEDGSLKGS